MACIFQHRIFAGIHAVLLDDTPVLHQQIMHGVYGSYEPSHRGVCAALLQWLSLQGLQDIGGHHLHALPACSQEIYNS